MWIKKKSVKEYWVLSTGMDPCCSYQSLDRSRKIHSSRWWHWNVVGRSANLHLNEADGAAAAPPANMLPQVLVDVMQVMWRTAAGSAGSASEASWRKLTCGYSDTEGVEPRWVVSSGPQPDGVTPGLVKVVPSPVFGRHRWVRREAGSQLCEQALNLLLHLRLNLQTCWEPDVPPSV